MSNFYAQYSYFRHQFDDSEKVIDRKQTKYELKKLDKLYPKLSDVYDFWDFIHIHRSEKHLTQAEMFNTWLYVHL
ncbi:hypothetical protein J7384_13720 [Endozoicomonas sp. G2_1]|uniref:hypothetical protein n=1 Tax=Endozoicomonas sp. G2_1 TaxID=2821091 RepID=UPI001ADCC121|nr:hypothetical protein [Endozoicomonas sp. G2_1]MBO9491420.1 hypothetical protein [Endozoicomonas sp. G2_1]